MFKFTTDVDRVANAHDIDAVVGEGHDVVHVPHRL